MRKPWLHEMEASIPHSNPSQQETGKCGERVASGWKCPNRRRSFLVWIRLLRWVSPRAVVERRTDHIENSLQMKRCQRGFLLPKQILLPVATAISRMVVLRARGFLGISFHLPTSCEATIARKKKLSGCRQGLWMGSRSRRPWAPAPPMRFPSGCKHRNQRLRRVSTLRLSSQEEVRVGGRSILS